MLPATSGWLEVVGESFHREAFKQILGMNAADGVRLAVTCELIPEPSNQYDPNAVGVWVSGRQLGHLSKEDAHFVAPVLRSWMLQEPGVVFAAEGEIAGAGWDRCGVYLRMDTRDFGAPLTARTPAGAGGVRTGLSSAPAESITWFDGLSEDRLARVKQLRQLMSTEIDPISRHFVASELEEVLYRLRDDVPQALVEFDEVVEVHHQELQLTRTTLLTQYGGMPLLDTYRQASVRHQRAGDLDKALAWAERGIAVYDGQALRPEWLEDLERRAEKLRQRIQVAEAKAGREQRARDAKIEKASKAAEAARLGPAAAALDAEIETLVCQRCDRPFERVRSRGRKPHRCPDCAAGLATQ